MERRSSKFKVCEVHPLDPNGVKKWAGRRRSVPDTMNKLRHGKLLHDHHAVVQALDVLKQCVLDCTVNKHTSISKESVEHLVAGFSVLISEDKDLCILNEEENTLLHKNFASYSSVFDSNVQAFITQNFSQGGLKRQASRSLLRRHSKPCTDIDAIVQWGCPSHVIDDVQLQLSLMTDWTFNMFELRKLVSSQNILLVMGSSIFAAHDLLKRCNIDANVLKNFLMGVAENYLSNPYHNAEHAADVGQAMHYLLSTGGLAKLLSPLSILASIVAAIVHDAGHPARTNNFLISVDDPLALQYSFRSPLENLHCATAFHVMKKPGSNILSELHTVARNKVRHLIVDMIMATDNAVHSLYLTKFQNTAANAKDDAFDSSQDDNQKILLQMALHAADVNNPAKPFPVYEIWIDRIMEEFYVQGDDERKRGMEVSVGYDRLQPIPQEKMQAGFIIGIVKPVYTALASVESLCLTACLDTLEENLQIWQAIIQQSAVDKKKNNKEI